MEMVSKGVNTSVLVSNGGIIFKEVLFLLLETTIVFH